MIFLEHFDDFGPRTPSYFGSSNLQGQHFQGSQASSVIDGVGGLNDITRGRGAMSNQQNSVSSAIFGSNTTHLGDNNLNQYPNNFIDNSDSLINRATSFGMDITLGDEETFLDNRSNLY